MRLRCEPARHLLHGTFFVACLATCEGLTSAASTTNRRLHAPEGEPHNEPIQDVARISYENIWYERV